jgi:hypothetical protein
LFIKGFHGGLRPSRIHYPKVSSQLLSFFFFCHPDSKNNRFIKAPVVSGSFACFPENRTVIDRGPDI